MSEANKSRAQPAVDARAPSLKALALLFLRLGTTAFGGPAAHLALMEDEVVRRRNWLTHEQFLDLLGATNLIPGPNSTEMAIHIGYQQKGWAGLLVAGSCFILMSGPTPCSTGYKRLARS
jgi:chromate transporter